MAVLGSALPGLALRVWAGLQANAMSRSARHGGTARPTPIGPM